MKNNNTKTEFRIADKAIVVLYKDNDNKIVSYEVLPLPKNIQHITDRITKVTFSDGTYEKVTLAECKTPEELEAERREGAVAICLLKKLLEPSGMDGYGNNAYNKYIETAFREAEKRKKEAEELKRQKEETKERNIRRAKKKQRKADRRFLRRFERLKDLLLENENIQSTASLPEWWYANTYQDPDSVKGDDKKC